MVPHLSQRSFIKYPKNEVDIKSDLKEFNILLLNPLDPGWDSTNKLQKKYIKTAKENNWKCIKWDNGLELCEK